MRGRPRPLAVLLAIVLAGCNGEGDAATTTTAPESTSTTTSSTTTTSTSTTTTTSTTPSTVPTTTAPPAPTSSVDPADVEQEVSAAMVDFIGAVNDLMRDPDSADLRAGLGEAGTGRAVEFFIERADQYVDARRVARANPENPSRVDPIPASFAGAPGDLTTAVMDGCLIDTDIQVTFDEAGQEVEVEATPDSYLMIFSFVLEEDRWRVELVSLDQDFPDQVGCS